MLLESPSPAPHCSLILQLSMHRKGIHTELSWVPGAGTSTAWGSGAGFWQCQDAPLFCRDSLEPMGHQEALAALGILDHLANQ